MGKTIDLFKKIRDPKGTFHVKMDTIKDRNSTDLTKAEEVARIHRRTIQKEIFMTQIIAMVSSLTYSQTFWNAKSS